VATEQPEDLILSLIRPPPVKT